MTGRRGNNEGSIRKRADGRWEARVSINGKQRSLYGKTRSQAASKMREALRDAERGMPITDQRRTVAEFLAEWLQTSVQPTVRPSTYRNYEMHVRVHIVPSVGRHTLNRLAPQHVQRMLNDMSAAGKAPSTVTYTRAVLRRALAQAEEWGLVARNVAAIAKPPKANRPEVQPLSPEQARTFLAFVHGDRLEALYYVAICLGLRQGEILGLQWEDVDLDGKRLKVRRALQRIDGELTLVEPKTQRSRRTLALPQVVGEQLARHRERQERESVEREAKWPESDFVFRTSAGTPWDGVNVTKRFQRALREAGLPHQRFHDLRHTCASFLLAQGMSPRVIMDVLGHSQISLTMDTYSHVAPDLKSEAAERMDDLLGDIDV